MTNPAGDSVAVNLDASGRVTNVVNDASTALLTFGYASPDGVNLTNLSTVTDAYGRQIKYTFSLPSDSGTPYPFLRTVSQINSTNPLWQYDYLGGQLTSVITANPGGSGVSSPATTQYDNYNRVTKLVDANGNQRAYTYNVGSTQVSVYDPANTLVQQWAQKYDASDADTGRIDSANHSTSIAYGDPANPRKPTQIINKNGQADNRTYDAFGDLLTVTDLRGVVTTYTYDPAVPGQLISVQTGTKTATNITYYTGNATVGGVVQPNGLVKSVSKPAPGTASTGAQVTTTYVYTAYGNLASVTKPAPNTTSGATVTTVYNYTTDPGDGVHGIAAFSQAEGLGQYLTVTDPMGHVTHLRWNTKGQMMALIDALGHETDYAYNPSDDQLATVTYPATGQSGSGRSATQYTYWQTGGSLASISIFDEAGTSVRTVNYSKKSTEGEPIADTGNLLPTSYLFDAKDRLTQLTDGNNQPAQAFGYDFLDNLAALTYPLGDKVTYPNYDADNNLLQRTDGRGVTTTYARASDDGRITGISYTGATPNVTFQHDLFDRVTQMNDGSGVTTYAYDDDSVLRATSSFTSGPQNKSIAYGYNNDGTRSSMTTPFGTFSYAYDNAGRMTDVFSPWSGGHFTYTYDDTDRLTKQHFSKADTTYGYNSRNFMTSLLNASTFPGYGMLSNFYNIGYDAVGNRTNIAATIPQITYYDGSNLSYAPDASRGLIYGYDGADQFAAEFCRPIDNQAYNDTINWGFGTDGAGNLTTLRGSPITYDNDNRLTGQTYDGNSNPTTYQGFGVVYDAEDRITEITGLLTSGYTGDGQRAWKGDASRNNKTYFLYDGDKVVTELKADGTLINTFAYGPNGLVERYIHSIPGYIGYTFDPQGTLVQRHRQVDNFVPAADTAIYDAFGILDADVDGLNGGAYPGRDSVGYLGQSGHYTDRETISVSPGGLLSVGGTYYDAKQGRYVTRGSNINGFKALDNNPASYVDWLDVTQITIDTVGLIPVLNVPASVTSAGISAYKGDWAGAGMSLAAVIPFEGDAAEALKIARDAKGLTKEVGIAGRELSNESNLVAKEYGTLKNETKGTSDQSHHLNQNAAYGTSHGGPIPINNGLSIPLKGTIHSGDAHENFHRSMEEFWNEFRAGGSKPGDTPTNVQYSAALRKALKDAGVADGDIMTLVRQASRQRHQYGLGGRALVPRVLGRIPYK